MTGWRIAIATAGCLVAAAGMAAAAELHAEMRLATPTGTGDAIGTVTIADSAAGATIKTALKGLSPGPHGFHIHEKGSCQPSTANNQPVPAGAAGGHFDPDKSGRHEGPQGSGHLGDLPILQATPDGTANQTLTAPRLKDVAALKGKSVMIHAGGDNYSDQPAPLGGGGARVACGVIE